VPQPRIEWYKDAVPLSKLANARYKVSSATGLMVRRVQPGDGGIFQCFARSPAGETQVHTELLVSNDQRVIKGTTAVLACNATHDPRIKISFKWDRGGVPVMPSSGGRVSVRPGSLTISQTWSGDIGDYTCSVTSQAGNDSRSARLEVM
ncbi:hypothetical protein GOODEAATRI_004861, partial [Goodea atripinnis]